MGLDQYLYAKKYTFGNDFEEPTWQKKNADFQRLKKAIAESSANGDDTLHMDKTYGETIIVEMKIGYWRKANAVHQWFVDNCQNGEDDCRDAYVSREKLEELLSVTKEVLADHSKADELLPTQSGFFFGSTEYDEYYFQDLELTQKILENALSMSDEWDFGYQSSW
jgi:hypothetical protein